MLVATSNKYPHPTGVGDIRVFEKIATKQVRQSIRLFPLFSLIRGARRSNDGAHRCLFAMKKAHE